MESDLQGNTIETLSEENKTTENFQKVLSKKQKRNLKRGVDEAELDEMEEEDELEEKIEDLLNETAAKKPKFPPLSAEKDTV